MTTPMSDREALAAPDLRKVLANVCRAFDLYWEEGVGDFTHLETMVHFAKAELFKADQWLARSSGGGSKNANEAQRLLTLIRSGGLDPRPAAVALGLPFDQDIITGILELAALARSSGGGERDNFVTAKILYDADRKPFENIAVDPFEETDRFTQARYMRMAAALPSPAPSGGVSDAEIDAAFTGYGMALRGEGDAPIPGEPLMSMADAKRITRELIKAAIAAVPMEGKSYGG